MDSLLTGMMIMNRKLYGFTLIELMIVVAIVGILAAVAYPAYQRQVLKSRRADATGALLGLAGGMERYFTENGTYVGATAAGVYFDHSPIDGGTTAYNLSVSASTATTYTLNAAPTSIQSDDQCGTLSIDNTGAKGVSDSTVAECWY